MSKGQFIALFGFIVFYTVMASVLFVRAIIAALPSLKSSHGALVSAATLKFEGSRAWTKAVWRESVSAELNRVSGSRAVGARRQLI